MCFQEFKYEVGVMKLDVQKRTRKCKLVMEGNWGQRDLDDRSDNHFYRAQEGSRKTVLPGACV